MAQEQQPGCCGTAGLWFSPLSPQETKLSARVFLQGKALRVQLDLRRYGRTGPAGAVGRVPLHPAHSCSLPAGSASTPSSQRWSHWR